MRHFGERERGRAEKADRFAAHLLALFQLLRLREEPTVRLDVLLEVKRLPKTIVVRNKEKNNVKLYIKLYVKL